MLLNTLLAVGALAGLIVLAFAIGLGLRARRSHDLGPVSGEWLVHQRVRDRRAPNVGP